MRPATAPVLSWENWLFTLTGWPYVVRGVFAGTMSVIRPKQITFKVTPKSPGGMPALPASLLTPYLAFTTGLSSVAIYGEYRGHVLGYVLLCIFGATSYSTVSILVPLLHIREAARGAGVRFTQALRTARWPLTLALATTLPLGFAMAHYVPDLALVLHL
jgi:hypothetical protein